MHIIKSNIEKKRLDVTLNGVISFEEAEEIKKQIIKESENFEPGFDIVNNISKFIQGDDKAGMVLQQVIEHMKQKGVNRILRVVGTSKTGLLQFAKYTNDNDEVEIHYFPTMEDADKFLENN